MHLYAHALVHADGLMGDRSRPQAHLLMPEVRALFG